MRVLDVERFSLRPEPPVSVHLCSETCNGVHSICSVDLLSRVSRSDPGRSGDFELTDDAGVPPYAHGRICPDPIEGLVGYYVDGKSSKYFKGPRPVKAIDHTYSEMVLLGF
jgi:hypothetical protein